MEDAARVPLRGMRIVTLAVNAPGPVAATRLRELGAAVTKVEPPAGDPLAGLSPSWYARLAAGQTVMRLDLKDGPDRARLDELLSGADLLLTSNRPAALGRLGLSWAALHARFPRLCHVAIVGHPPPREDEPGHDLTYLAEHGMLSPPQMPRTLLADLAGAEKAVSAALGLLLARERGRGAGYAEVALSEAAAHLAEPLRHGLTREGGPLGGGMPGYGLYRASDGWIAVAALEPRFLRGLLEELEIEEVDRETLGKKFARHTAGYWERWAAERDLPVVALRDVAKRHGVPEKEERTCSGV
ncbi:MAG: CoA transferase [Actinomycetota bacterium]